jgi:large subunit ribosomal protein L22
MTGPKTNERPGTRAVLRDAWVSATKVRVVLDLIRGLDVERAREVLQFCERDAATLVGKLLDSAIANAEKNDSQVPDELYVSACYADEGRTNKRWRPRARGRATRIRKRTCHVTVIVSRLPDDRLTRLRAKRAAEESTRRARRVAGGRRGSEATQAGARGAARRRRRGQGDEATSPEASDDTVATAEIEEQGIVDVDAAAVEAAEDAVAEDTVTEEAATEEAATEETPTDDATSEEEEGDK